MLGDFPYVDPKAILASRLHELFKVKEHLEQEMRALANDYAAVRAEIKLLRKQFKEN